MSADVGRDEVRALVRDEGAQLVDVLPAAEFSDEHLAGAINIPLRRLDADTATALDPARPVIVYCHDWL